MSESSNDDFVGDENGAGKESVADELARKMKNFELGPAFEVMKSPDIGSFIVATRDLKENDLIVSEVPIVLGPCESTDDIQACIGCLRHIVPELDDIRCPRCRWPACDEECAGLTDKTRHGAECVVLAMVKSGEGLYSIAAILPFRCMLLQNRDPEKWALLLEMATEIEQVLNNRNSEDREEAPDTQFLEEDILQPLSNLAPKIIPDCSEETIRKIALLVYARSLSHNRPNCGKVAGVTKVASLMEHSCMPNTRVYFEYPDPLYEDSVSGVDSWRGKVVVRAATDIRKGDHLTTLVCEVQMFSWFRQREIKSKRNARCVCERCLDFTELGTNYGTFLCSDSGSYLPLDVRNLDSCDWQCSLTGDKLSNLAFFHLFQVAFKPFETAYNEDCSVERLEEILAELEQYLHPGHCFCILIKKRIAIIIDSHKGKRKLSALPLERLKKKKALCEEALDVYLNFNVISMSETNCTGELLRELVYANLELMKRNNIDRNTKKGKEELAKNRQLFVRAVRIALANYSGPEETYETETEEQQKAFLATAKKLGYVFRIPEIFLS